MSDSEASIRERDRKKPSEVLRTYIRGLSHQDLVKILTPIKASLLSDETVLVFDKLNLSADHVEFSFTVRDFLDILGPSWQKWIHSSGSDLENNHYHYSAAAEMHDVRYGEFDGGFDVESPPIDFVSDFIGKLTKHQKRSILMLARDGLLTDESFINVCVYTGPDRIQVNIDEESHRCVSVTNPPIIADYFYPITAFCFVVMSISTFAVLLHLISLPFPFLNCLRMITALDIVVYIIGAYERQRHEEFFSKPFFTRLLRCCHLSSADFDYAKKADLDVRQLSSGRQKMPIYFTLLFALMTFLTFLSHIWSNITNYVDIQKQSLWLSLGIVSIASLLIGALMYLVTYIVGFLFCCESNMQPLSIHPIADMNKLQKHFFEIHQFEYRIYATRIIQFILLWYTMLLAIYAREYDLNIYPALSCVLTNGFGLLLFMRITHFLHACRRGSDEDTLKVLYAR